MAAADPKATSVLSVGLEQYGFDSKRSLPGVASYAVRFAEWAMRAGVRPKRVRLACSWVEQPGPYLPECTHVEPTAEGLVKALLDLLAEGGELLLLYWCGHGVAAQGARAVFTANADDVLRANLPIDKVRSLLASSHGLGFPRQVLLFDACANHFEKLGYVGGLPPAQIPDIPPRGGTQQYFYFATDVGRIAGYNRSTQQAAFSTEVIRWLEGQPLTTFPPDVDALRAHVESAFDATTAAAAGATGAGSGPPIPVTLVVQDFSGNEIEKTFGAGKVGLYHSQLELLLKVIAGGLAQTSVEFRQAVVAELDRAAIGTGPDSLGSAIATAFKSGEADAVLAVLKSVAAQAGSADEMFVNEIQLCWERQLRIAPLVRPLEAITLQQVREAHALAVAPGSRVVVHNLVQALDDAAHHLPLGAGFAPIDVLVSLLERQTGQRIEDSWFELDPQELAALRAGAAPRLAAAGGRARLLIDLRSRAAIDGTVTWPATAVAQLWHNGDWSERHEIPCGPTDADAAVAVEAAIRWAGLQVGTYSVGLVVSRLLHDRLPEAWMVREEDDDAPAPLGLLFPVVLHSAERLASGRKHTSWTERLASLRNRPPGLDMDWVAAPPQRDPATILMAVEASQATCIGLEFPPGPAARPLGNDAVMATVRGGAPYLAWFETEPAAWPAARAEAEWVVAGGGLRGVAQRLFELRRAAPETIATGLRLMWDDDAELPDVAPLQAGQSFKVANAAVPATESDGS